MGTNRLAKIIGITALGLLALAATLGGATIGTLAGASPTSMLAQDPIGKIDRRVMQDTLDGRSTSVVVLLSDQADVSAAYSMNDQDARGWYVYNTLRSH